MNLIILAKLNHGGQKYTDADRFKLDMVDNLHRRRKQKKIACG
jgi:hypothetical protein